MEYTSYQDAQWLIKKGLKIETADLILDSVNPDRIEIGSKDAKFFKDSIYYPLWSLSRLLELMPKYIRIDNTLCYLGSDLFANRIFYQSGFAKYKETKRYKTLIEAAVEMIDWLLSNDYKLEYDRFSTDDN